MRKTHSQQIVRSTHKLQRNCCTLYRMEWKKNILGYNKRCALQTFNTHTDTHTQTHTNELKNREKYKWKQLQFTPVICVCVQEQILQNFFRKKTHPNFLSNNNQLSIFLSSLSIHIRSQHRAMQMNGSFCHVFKFTGNLFFVDNQIGQRYFPFGYRVLMLF